MPEISQAWLALIGAVIGGSGLKFIEYWLTRSKVRDDSAAEFRKELREEVLNLRTELRKTEEELEEWRAKYYAIMEEMLALKNDLDTAKRLIQRQVDEASG